MKSALTYLIAGVVSTLVTLPAWAQDSSNYLVAPPLLVAGDGPVTLTFQGGTYSLPRIFTWAPFSSGPGLRANWPSFTISGRQITTAPLSAGTFVTFGVPFSPAIASVSWATTALPAGVNMGQLVMELSGIVHSKRGRAANAGGQYRGRV